MIKKEGHGSEPCKYRVFILATSCLEDVWEESGRSREVQEKKAVTGPTEQIGGKGPGTSRCCKHGRSRQTSARLRLCDVVPPQIGPESYRIKVPGVVTFAEEWGGKFGGFKLRNADLAPNSSYFLDPQMEMGVASW